jgi:hypothetical protein
MSKGTETPTKPDVAREAETKASTRSEVRFDDSKTVACYANFCRVTGTPEEMIIDFGLNNQPMGTPTEPIPIAQRIIVNFFTAKRLLGALSMAVQRHESAFGVLETDVNKRVQPAAIRATAPPPPPQKG